MNALLSLFSVLALQTAPQAEAPPLEQPLAPAEPPSLPLATEPTAPTVEPPVAPLSAVPADRVLPVSVPQPVAPLWINTDDKPVWLHARAELGSLAVLQHTIQFGQEGTEFDYVAAGGQNNLYLFARLEAEAVIERRHIVQGLYQPIDVRTQVNLKDDLRVYETQFSAGTPMNFRYGFDFVRMSYLYDFLDDRGDELALGAVLQLRNAVIDFSDEAGTQRVSNRNIGPVPALSARGRLTIDDGALAGLFVGGEATGFWASGRIITGSANDFEGAILDTSVRAGLPVTTFANFYVVARVIGGGARGVEEDSEEPGDGFTNNWLWTGSVAVGAELF